MQEHSFHPPSTYTLPLSEHLRGLSQIDVPHEVETHSPFPSISGSPHDIFHPAGSTPFSLPFSGTQQQNNSRRLKGQTKNALRFRYVSRFEFGFVVSYLLGLDC